VIDHLTKASKYANEKEPGVYRYMICLPADESDTTTVWAIEECDIWYFDRPQYHED
jgi:hypothetical protein